MHQVNSVNSSQSLRLFGKLPPGENRRRPKSSQSFHELAQKLQYDIFINRASELKNLHPSREIDRVAASVTEGVKGFWSFLRCQLDLEEPYGKAGTEEFPRLYGRCCRPWGGGTGFGVVAFLFFLNKLHPKRSWGEMDLSLGLTKMRSKWAGPQHLQRSRSGIYCASSLRPWRMLTGAFAW